jgi:hypothetical protein
LDEELSKEYGVILTSNIFDMAKDSKDLRNPGVNGLYNSDWNYATTLFKRKTKGGQFEFLDSLIDNYYAEAKLEHMYQFNDYFSDKYKIRNKITKEMGKRVSLKEINGILNKLISDTRRQYNDDLSRIPEFRYMNKDFTNQDFNILNVAKEDYGEVSPDIYDDDVVASQNTNSVYNQIKDIKIKVEKEDEKNVIDLEENDLYEIEAFKTFKNDPVFKHYLHNHLSFFSEKLNDNFSSIPFTLKGIVHIFFI